MNSNLKDSTMMESIPNEKEDFNLSVIINDNTKKYLNSSKNTDIIQCALEYNNYLINYIIENKHQMSINDYEAKMNKLYTNLASLATNCDNYRKKFKLKSESEMLNKNISNNTENTKTDGMNNKVNTRRSNNNAPINKNVVTSNTRSGITITIYKNELNL